MTDLVKDLLDIGGVFYKNSDDPFSGKVIDPDDPFSGKVTGSYEGTLNYGKKEGEWVQLL